MTAFEKSLRALGEEALRAGAEELLSLLTEGGDTRRGRGGLDGSGGEKYGGVSPDGGNSIETAAAPAAGIRAPGKEGPETARVRRAASETDSSGPAAEGAPGDTAVSPARAKGLSEVTGREDRKERRDREVEDDREDPEHQAEMREREKQEDRMMQEDQEKPENQADLRDRERQEDRKDQKDREDQEDRNARKRREGREERNNREGQSDREDRVRTIHTQDEETLDRAETQALERRLQSVSARRRGSRRQTGGDEDGGGHTAVFRGPERQYEGAVGARGTEMRRISDYFRRYDTGFTRY